MFFCLDFVHSLIICFKLLCISLALYIRIALYHYLLVLLCVGFRSAISSVDFDKVMLSVLRWCQKCSKLALNSGSPGLFFLLYFASTLPGC